jgi:hypothetical protein
VAAITGAAADGKDSLAFALPPHDQVVHAGNWISAKGAWVTPPARGSPACRVPAVHECPACEFQHRSTPVPTHQFRKPPRLLALAIGLLYASAFVLPAIHDGGQQINFPRLVPNPAGGVPSGYWDPLVPGWVLFVQVPDRLPYTLAYLPSWLSNFAMLGGLWCLARGRWKAARIVSAVGFGLALTSLPLVVEAHNWMTPHVGYFTWLCSMGLLAAVAWAYGRGAKKRPWREDSNTLVQVPSLGGPDERVREGREERVLR